MPTYDYRCEANGMVTEVRHRMSEEIKTWGELCELSGREVGTTPAETPVIRLATGGNVITSSKPEASCRPTCSPNMGGCPGGGCGLQ